TGPRRGEDDRGRPLLRRCADAGLRHPRVAPLPGPADAQKSSAALRHRRHPLHRRRPPGKDVRRARRPLCKAHPMTTTHDCCSHKSLPSPAAVGDGPGEYTCPMHPEVISDKPGPCPICGMALEPRVVTLDEKPNEELIDMQQRFAVSAILTVPLMIPLSPWLHLALATPVVLWGGAPFFVRGWRSLVTRNLNMFTLIALGTGAAFGYSVAAIFFGRHDLYFEPAAVITTLVLLGQVLELRAREKTSGAIKALLGLAPKT